ncbi:MAG: glycosyltransferase family 2 protein [Bacteroidales bacterium]|nr:glycosyltransferase family 2 protein [Bacteroidales bacterium]HNW73404.1 glycosyltransferase family 2 protein [Bacteroidales bacterium]HPS50768.1 glycosyltransferase family 2 protein [Bacteroidales bacterium]
MVGETLIIIINILQAVLFFYFLIAVLYFAFFSMAGLFTYHPKKKKDERLRKFAVLIPGYKEDAVIVDVARQALDQDYPSSCFEVIIIADSFKAETLTELKKLPIRVVEVSFEKSSKARALNKAMSLLPDDYDAAVILDADNLMEHNFITLMNDSLSAGYLAIQGHRMSKNRNTSFAILDSVSEEINNHIFRKGHRVAGISSALIGSGMAFDYGLFKSYMSTIDSFGEDKELEIKLLKNKYTIEYREDARVYDEKVQKSNVFLVQRTRWIANQIIYARQYFFSSIRELFVNGNIDYFDKVFQQFLPPRIFLIGFLFIISVLSLFFNPMLWTLGWIGITLITSFTLLIAVPRPYFNLQTLKAVMLLPKGFLVMMGSLFRIFKAKKGFGHTTHGVTKEKP